MEPTPTPEPQQRPAQPPADSPFMSIISALIFIWFGFIAPFVAFENDPPLQKLSITAFNWMARIVGIGLLLVVGLSYARVSLARPLDFFLALLATVGCWGAGLIWLINGYTTTALLILIFGLLNGSATRTAWRIWQRR